MLEGAYGDTHILENPPLHPTSPRQAPTARMFMMTSPSPGSLSCCISRRSTSSGLPSSSKMRDLDTGDALALAVSIRTMPLALDNVLSHATAAGSPLCRKPCAARRMVINSADQEIARPARSCTQGFGRGGR